MISKGEIKMNREFPIGESKKPEGRVVPGEPKRLLRSGIRLFGPSVTELPETIKMVAYMKSLIEQVKEKGYAVIPGDGVSVIIEPKR